MLLEDQIVRPELSKKLQELGVEQIAVFWWELYVANEAGSDTGAQRPKIVFTPNRSAPAGGLIENVEYCAAFTVAELGEMLPNRVYDEEVSRTYAIRHLKTKRGEWHIKLRHGVRLGSGNIRPITKHELFEENEADARAKMLIYLLENNLLNI